MRIGLPLIVSALFGLAVPASADYTLILKNGRRITAQSYREEGSMVKIQGLGGEFGIPKDQIQTIRTAGDTDQNALSLSRPKPVRITESEEAKRTPTSEVTKDETDSAEKNVAEQKAKEEKEYQQRVKEVTEQIRELRDRYSAETRGNKGSDPAFFTTEEAFRGHQEDLLSRLRDAQNKAQGLATGSDSKSPPFSLNPPPAYTDKQKELSNLRNQMIRLEGERERLIEEMKQKKFDSGSLFIE